MNYKKFKKDITLLAGFCRRMAKYYKKSGLYAETDWWRCYYAGKRNALELVAIVLERYLRELEADNDPTTAQP